ncbi:MauE/DoxX family redox-associated membrane protein [Nocardia wallacei]|uniref:MauE/DoxX family redox-associated membrane protein n=1 Tax=Nocardia wallacei TaxID=480035 RepID=UPI002457AC2F|nr:MauE/DoxX family redox-associated membrane protein [Nocardia wallacei]
MQLLDNRGRRQFIRRYSAQGSRMVIPVSLSGSLWVAFELATRFVVGGFLIARGVGMLTSTSAWRQVWFAAHQLLPAPLVRPVARLLPVAEMLAGISLLLGVFGAASAMAAAIVLASTTVAAGVALRRGLVLSGGSLCRLQPLLSPYALLRNIFLIVALGTVVAHGSFTLALSAVDPWTQALTLTVAMGAAGAAISMTRRAQRQRLLADVASTR